MAKKKEIKKEVNASEFAKIMGVARQTVNAAIKKGRISATKTDGGRFIISVEKAKKEWEANTDKTAQAKGNVNKKKILTVAAKNKKGFEDNPEGARTYNGMTTADAERQEKFYKAELAKLKYQEQSGLLMETEKIKKAAFAVSRSVRDNVMSVAAKHSHELAAETDPHKLEVLLSKQLSDALGETISVDFEKIKRDK